MPGVDWLPGISQIKSGFQLITGDVDGAIRTQKNFAQECPGVSQVTSVVQLATGDAEGALETQKRCLGTINNVANGLPVVGHVKGGIHHLVGDHEGGNEALNAATRTTVVMASGAAAGIATGGIGAIPAGIAAGGAYDVAATVITEKPQGYIAAYDKVAKDPSAGNIFDAVCVHVGDGLTGYSGGEVGNKIATKVKINKLEGVRAAKTEQLHAGMFEESGANGGGGGGMSSGQVQSLGHEINALTKEINTLQGKQAMPDLKGNQVPNNSPSTSTGGVPAYVQNKEEKQEKREAPVYVQNKEEKQEQREAPVYVQNKEKELDVDLREELDIFKSIHDKFGDALEHDFYANEEDAGESKKDKEASCQKCKNETPEADPLQQGGYPVSKRDTLKENKNKFQRQKPRNALKRIITQRTWLHVRMPEEFNYTGGILLNHANSGLLHSVIRHYNEWQNFIPSLQNGLNNISGLGSYLKKIVEAENMIDSEDAIKAYLEALKELQQNNYNQFIDLQSEFFDYQLDLHEFIENNVTYDNYLGEGFTDGRMRVFFKVKDLYGNIKVMAVGVSNNDDKKGKKGLHPPDPTFGDKKNRPIRRITTVFIMSWEDYLRQVVTKLFKRE